MWNVVVWNVVVWNVVVWNVECILVGDQAWLPFVSVDSGNAIAAHMMGRDHACDRGRTGAMRGLVN